MCLFFEKEDFIFNTDVYQKICVNDKEGELITKKAIEIMRDFEERLSFYKESSEVSKINNNAGENFVEVSQDTFEIIDRARQCSEFTNGLFDITIAPLVKEWGINTYNPAVIGEDKIKQLLSLVNYDDIILDRRNISVMLAKENQKIDLGGIAKGYIADKVIEFYKESGITSAIINLGGNVKVLGKKDNNELWNVGIYSPIKHSEEVICSLTLENYSVVTSGGYERGFISNGELYHHILNPLTGYPAKTDLKSITIVSEESFVGDTFSTPLFIMGKEKAAQFMKNNKINGVMITEDDEIIISKELIDSFNLLKKYKVLAF